jgi:hypothetical protein
MSMGPQYTSCVEPADFELPNSAIVGTLAGLIVVGGIAALFSAGIGALIAIAALVQLLRYVLDFMLNGKLICLHRNPSNPCVCSPDGGTVCAIGEVADTESVGEDKNPIADVDNDYSMNVILSPFNMSRFAANNGGISLEKIPDAICDANYKIATDPTQPQGDLLKRDLPAPIAAQEETLLNDEPLVGKGYFRTMIGLNTGEYHAWTEIIGRDYGWFGIVGPDQEKLWVDYVLDPKRAGLRPQKFPVPVLHCEFEGTRIRDMLAAIEAFSFGGKWCKSNFFTRALCTILQTIFAPLALIAVGIAWAAARDGTASDALEGGGTINSKDKVIVRGRWAYDGGHTGWPEIHATRIVQKVENIPNDLKAFEAFREHWCELLSEVPHVIPADVHPADQPPLTPPQQTVYDNQQKPENQWTFHPEVDGCEPTGDGDPDLR